MRAVLADLAAAPAAKRLDKFRARKSWFFPRLGVAGI
jgi:hypothetical protein